MAFAEIASRHPMDKDLPLRSYRLAILRSFMDGTFYDVLSIPFQQETDSSSKYVPLRHRRPALHFGWANEVVSDTSALLFGEGHFPAVECEDETLSEWLEEVLEEIGAPLVMGEAMEKGAIGSVAILVEVVGQKEFSFHVSILDTVYLTPFYDPEDPRKIILVRERRKVKGEGLREAGYSVSREELTSDFWFQREWTESEDRVYVPLKADVDRDGNPIFPTAVDQDRSTVHALGFVPVVWIKNLRGGSPPDGKSTLTVTALDAIVEADYQMSQLGRGLKYSQDPMKVISLGSSGEELEKIIAGSDIMVLPEGSEAKLLEYSGESGKTVMEFISDLRKYTIRSMSGSPIDPEKISVPQSGRAMEIMNMALIQLADRLRGTYGRGLLDLCRMLVRFTEQRKMRVGDLEYRVKSKIPKLTLRWPAWYPPTAMDRLQDSQAVTGNIASGVLSRESATAFIGPEYGVNSATEETERIRNEQKEITDNARRSEQPNSTGS